MKLIVKVSNLVGNITNFFSNFFNSQDLGLKNKANHQSQWLTNPYQPNRNFSQSASGSRKIKNLGPKYTSQEVIKYLRGQGESERAAWVIREASSFYVYDPQQVPPQFRGRERLYEKLPFVLYKYSQGWSTQEIAKSVSYFSTAEDVEEALLYISEVIARRINANLKASA
jgi:hypothetical protein